MKNIWLHIHNAIAHPLLITNTQWANRFHDWTFEKHQARQPIPRQKLKVYLSGPISGLPIEEVKAAFDKWEHDFKCIGAEVVNPVTLCKDLKDKSWENCMKVDIKHLMDCDAVFLMKKWSFSKGCMVEHNLASILRIPIIHEHSNSEVIFTQIGNLVKEKDGWNISKKENGAV